jgi:hypothetical protein
MSVSLSLSLSLTRALSLSLSLSLSGEDVLPFAVFPLIAEVSTKKPTQIKAKG